MPTDSRTVPARVRMECPAEIERFTERQFQTLLVDSARMMGWLCVHIRQMIGNPEGLPDLLLWRGETWVRPNNDDPFGEAKHITRALLFELKTVKGVVSGVQHHWHAEAAASGVTVHVLRPTPADWERAMDLLA